jgi:hypothetical protein
MRQETSTSIDCKQERSFKARVGKEQSLFSTYSDFVFPYQGKSNPPPRTAFLFWARKKK